MEPKSLPGPPWEGEISPGNFSGGLPEDNNEFFSAPRASGSVLGASRGGSWSPVGAQEDPGGLQDPFWYYFWNENGPPRLHFWSLFWPLWGSILVSFALCPRRPRVDVDLLALASGLFWERLLLPKMGPESGLGLYFVTAPEVASAPPRPEGRRDTRSANNYLQMAL